MPLISVIVPAYNVEKYIEKCIDSILKQTFQDYEILLIDDGANDSTPMLCDKLALTDNRIKVYHKKNGGLSDARNYGLDRMTGEFVTFIDSDDYVSENYLEFLYSMIIEEDNIQISMVQGQSLQEHTLPREVKFVTQDIISAEQAARRMMLRNDATHTSWGKLYCAFLWDKMRFPLGQNYEDYATTYHVFAMAERVACSNNRLYYYMQHGESIMHQTCSEKTLSVLDVSDSVTEFIINRWSASKIEALDLQVAVYLKNMQAIMNTGKNNYIDYQKRIRKKVRENAIELLLAKQVPRKDKIKILLLLINKKIFLKVYNANNGDIAV